MYGMYTDVSESNPLYRDYYGCTRCPEGSYADENADKLNCRKCPPGTFGVIKGSVAAQSSTDWRGNVVDPGCMPCPNGTYNTKWGQTACLLCNETTQSCGIATVTPLPAYVRPWEWTELVATRWKVIKVVDSKLKPLLPFQLPLPPYNGQ